MFFTDQDGNYNHDPKKLKDVYKWCQDEILKTLLKEYSVVVSNTFVKQLKAELTVLLNKADLFE